MLSRENYTRPAMTNDLMDEWEEFQRFERWQASRPTFKPQKEPVNPHLAYTQGPQGNIVPDWKAFGGNPTPEQLAIHSMAPDMRDNRDPEQVWNEILEHREQVRRIHGGFKVIDEIAEDKTV
jgi:hypothetical protein